MAKRINWTKEAEDELVCLAKKYKNIIESKQTDAVTNRFVLYIKVQISVTCK